MLWNAIVYKNSEFDQTGLIEVVLNQKYRENGTAQIMAKKLSELGSQVGRSINEGLTSKCLILSSGLGAGNNTGVFSVPQVGTRGIVAEIDDRNRFGGINYIWLGGVYGLGQYGQEKSIPRDDTEDDIGTSDKALSVSKGNSTSDYVTKGAYIIKTKTNNVENYNTISSKNEMENIPAENTFLLNKEKAVLKHNVNSGSEQIGVESLKLNDNSIVLTRKTKESDQTLKFDSNETSLKIKGSSGQTNIIISADGNVNITTSGNMNISADGNMNLMSSGNMNISADGTMNLVSKQPMGIKGKEKSLIELFDTLMTYLSALRTFGSPATHNISPETVAKIKNVQNFLGANYSK